MYQLNLDLLKLDSVFVEFRFNDIFTLPDNKYKILEKLTPKYPTYNIESTDRVSLFNHENEIEIHIWINRMIIQWNRPKNIKEFLKILRSVESEIKKILRIQKYNRVGIRAILGHEVDNPTSGQNYILNRYFSSGAKELSNLSNDIINPNISFSGASENIQFNFAVRFQQKESINISFGQPQQTQQLIENLLIFDIDVYKEHNITDNTLDKYLRSTEIFISEKLIDYIKRVER